MTDYKEMLEQIKLDPRYLGNLEWGKPRPGHPEGTVKAHIAELEENLRRLAVSDEREHSKLLLLIHVHDSFKKDSKKGVAINDPQSHASLAQKFLSDFCRDQDLLNMVGYHDEPYALYRQEAQKGNFNRSRLDALKSKIGDWTLFLKFLLIDGHTPGKCVEPLLWCERNIASSLGLSEQVKTWLDLLKRAEPHAARSH